MPLYNKLTTTEIDTAKIDQFIPCIVSFKTLVMNLFERYYTPTITSMADGLHSKHSLHYTGDAIDMRIKDLFDGMGEHRLRFIAMKLGQIYKNMFFILHVDDGKNHLHIQLGRKNILNANLALGVNSNVFIK